MSPLDSVESTRELESTRVHSTRVESTNPLRSTLSTESTRLESTRVDSSRSLDQSLLDQSKVTAEPSATVRSGVLAGDCGLQDEIRSAMMYISGRGG
jgi:hypothetical protein